jgi:hypothetical protein
MGQLFHLNTNKDRCYQHNINDTFNTHILKTLKFRRLKQKRQSYSLKLPNKFKYGSENKIWWTTVFARIISAPVYFAHPNFWRTILDLFLLRVFHAPSYCSFTSNLTMFSLIIDYWINNGINSAFIMIIINLIIDKSRMLQNYNKILTKCTIFSIILE